MKKTFFITFFSALLMTICLGLGHSEADTSIENGPQVPPFGGIGKAQIFLSPSQQGDDGTEPSVAINSDNYVVQIHKSQDNYGLWYRCGKVNPNNVLSWAASQKFGHGRDPSVTMNDGGYVIEVHRGDDSKNLWSRCGKYDYSNGTINWETGYPYGTGVTPSVSLNNEGYFIEVHRGDDSTNLWSRCGKYDFANKTLSWAAGHQFGSGYDPSVTMNDDGFLVEVHQGDDSYNLWYRCGKYDFSNGTVSWAAGHIYASGESPSVTMDNDGYVVEVHKGHADYDNLYYHVGKYNFTNGTIDWSPVHYFDTGKNPAVAANKNYAVQVHTSENADTLWYSSALLVDHSRWMEDLRDVIGNKPLWQITLPGTHDAGMYTTEDILIDEYSFFEKLISSWVRDHWVTTQRETIWQQLNGGVRYFDLRPAWHDDTLYIYHSFAGPKVKDVFDDIQNFMDQSDRSGAGELVILVLSHFHGFNDPAYLTFGQLITTYLDKYLYKVDDPKNTNLLGTTFNQYTKENGNSFPRILFLVKSSEYDDWVETIHPTTLPTGVWPYQEMDCDDKTKKVAGSMRIINDYANTPDRATMEKDQLNKLVDSQGGGSDRAFLLSWTLTAGGNWEWWVDRVGGSPPKSIHEMSCYVKPQLPGFLREWVGAGSSWIINYLFTDYYDEAATVDLAILFHKGLLSEPPGPPALDIKANGQDDGILIRSGTPVSITVRLDPGYRANLNADWWIAVNTPMGWYSYVHSKGWQPGLHPYIQTSLIELTPPLELPGISLGNGLYTYYFAVDDNSDGVPDSARVDKVHVNITSWR